MKRKMTLRKGLLMLAMAVSLVFMIPASGMSAEGQGQTDMQMQDQTQQGTQMDQQSGTGMDQQQQQKQAQSDVEQPQRRIERAATTLQNMMDRTGERIPPEVIANAQGIAIFPEVTKAGVIVGGRYGTGVLMLKQNNEWNGPLFLSVYGASVGAQLGVESTDLIMVFNNQDALKELQDGTLEFGAEASVAAGPWGEKAKASTQADIMAYKQTGGVFAGISLSSGYIEVNPEANNQYFQQEQTGETRAYYPSAEEMIQGKKAPETEQAGQLTQILDQYSQQSGQQQQQSQ